jgi:hypothetical protein
MVRSLSMPEHSGDENVIASTLELILIMVVREGAAQENAQLISRIVASVVVRSYALRVQISKGAFGAELLGAGKDGHKDVITLRAPCRFAKWVLRFG